jgi:hypothetical protein
VLLFSFRSKREGIEWAGGYAEMPLGEMQIDRRFLKVATPEQHLDGPQVGAGFALSSDAAEIKSLYLSLLRVVRFDFPRMQDPSGL